MKRRLDESSSGRKWIEMLWIPEIKEQPTPAVYLRGVCKDLRTPLRVLHIKHGCRLFWLFLSFNYQHVIEIVPRKLITPVCLDWAPPSQITWAQTKWRPWRFVYCPTFRDQFSQKIVTIIVCALVIIYNFPAWPVILWRLWDQTSKTRTTWRIDARRNHIHDKSSYVFHNMKI